MVSRRGFISQAFQFLIEAFLGQTKIMAKQTPFQSNNTSKINSGQVFPQKKFPAIFSLKKVIYLFCFLSLIIWTKVFNFTVWANYASFRVFKCNLYLKDLGIRFSFLQDSKNFGWSIILACFLPRLVKKKYILGHLLSIG